MSNSDKDRRYINLGLRIVGEFGAIIAVPVVLLAMLGKYLDDRHGTEPWLLIAGFIIAFTLSGLSIYSRAKRFRDEYIAIDPESFAGPSEDKDIEEAPSEE
ncbi:MAG: AtpZ/AtpI family protein [Patescibacteria group bacterium]|nr:AtpZ/AtpI family protein [Patescibacteria group bacterium]